LEREFAAEFSKKKNGESLRLRGLDGIENISFLLQYFGVSEGANFEKWHSEFEISVRQLRDCKFLDLQTSNQEEDGKPQIFPALSASSMDRITLIYTSVNMNFKL